MKDALVFKFVWRWIAIIDKQHYPLKGIYPVFLQNVLELIFLVGFVWYLNWSPVFVLVCCIVEAIALCLFSTLKTKSSIGFLDRKKYTLAGLATSVCFAFCTLQLLVFFKLNPQDHVARVIDLLWSNNEFLFCVFAVILQQYLEFVKYKKTMQLFSSDLGDTFVSPVLKMLSQQIVMLLVMLLMLFVHISLLWQALLLAAAWTVVKTLLGQIQVAFIPVAR